VLKVWRAGVPTVAVALLSSALIVLDLSDGAFRRWWSARAFTTDAIAGILVVLITVLIVNQVLEIRRNRERFRATAAQASMVLGQAIRSTRAVLACTTSGDRTAASDELRTYMIILMIAAPILIESKTPRAFLEDSQTLGGMLVHVQHSESQISFKTVPSDAQLGEALRQLKITAAPLLAPLTAEERTAAGTEETSQPWKGIHEPSRAPNKAAIDSPHSGDYLSETGSVRDWSLPDDAGAGHGV
jgi:hypothetical protein